MVNLSFSDGLILGSPAAKRAFERGDPLMIFDWDKAANLILTHKPNVAEAGLLGDWDYTGGVIYQDGEVVKGSYTYLASMWAKPTLIMDGKYHDCFLTEDNNPNGYESDTSWPESALEVLS